MPKELREIWICDTCGKFDLPPPKGKFHCLDNRIWCTKCLTRNQYSKRDTRSSSQKLGPIVITPELSEKCNLPVGYIVDISNRELECLVAAGRGLEAKETAKILGISHCTVHYHLDNLRHKLDVHKTLAAVHVGRILGVIR